ncbi:MAG: hypothetical protein Q9211_006630 [Gyalolechia sp. 1 TL-2023]
MTEEAGRLCTASLDPPVTKKSLNELELTKIVTDARLRHDLNFEHEIMFRPNTLGTRRTTKQREEDLYFEALAVELERYIKDRRNQESPSPHAPSPSYQAASRPNAHTSPSPPARVPRMLAAIREVVKTLVPAAKWQTVDDQFDVQLRMQELENGICDMARLIEWLGELLLGSCSPMRDPVVTAMVTRTREAISAQDVHQLVNAVKDLFGVLETMKLDVANHQIRYLRLYLLEDGIQFEQSEILSRIAAGWPISHERRWFETVCDDPEQGDRFSIFMDRSIERIVLRSNDFPLTFSADYDRLYAIQQDFRLCHYDAACIATFTGTLHHLGWRGPLSDQSHARSMQKVWAVIAGLGRNFAFKAHSSVVLQIVTEAFQVCNIPALPDHNTCRYTLQLFKAALDDTGEVKGQVWDEFARVVGLEADFISGMTPLEILNRYDPGPSGPGESPRKAEWSLESLARRTAHVLVLHWRVWAPIFYHQPTPRSSPAISPTTISPEQEMSERRSVPVSDLSGQDRGPTSTVISTLHRSRTVSSRSRSKGYTPEPSDAGSSTSGHPDARTRTPSL